MNKENLKCFIMNMLSQFEISAGTKDFESFPDYKKRYNKALDKYTKKIMSMIKGSEK